MKYKLVIIALVLLMAASCSVPKNTQLPTVKNMPDSFAIAGDTESIANLSWKEFFHDKYLTALIDTALRNNPDLAIALQRIEVARAELYTRKGALYPTVDAVVTAGVDKFGDYTMNGVGNFDTNLSPNISKDQAIPRHPTPDLFLGLRSNWEIDLWGKLKSLKKSAMLRFMATEQGRRFAVTSLVSQVAELYYELLALDYELNIVRKNVVLQQEALEVIRIQKEGGRATELAVQQFAAQLLNTRAIEFTIRQERIVAENLLNELLGGYPHLIPRDTSLMHQPLPAEFHTGSPAQLLIRRPDIVQAELNLQAAKSDLQAARVAFLPSLNLTPYAGLHSFKAGLLFNPGSIATGIAAGLSAPVLNRRMIKGAYSIANAKQKEALYDYQKTLLRSYNEVVTNLQNISNNQQAFELKQQEVQELQNAVATAKELYLAGYANYLEVITAQKGVLTAELELTENKKRLFQGLVRLYRSLGGGWH